VLEQSGLRAFPDLASASDALQALASPESPVTRLVELLRVHTDLAAPAIPGAGAVQAALVTRQQLVLWAELVVHQP
jgi:type VI protein secretion system component VasK